ncbi:MAG TPA: FAD-linked oxidase C-terminal domain-containing protein [Candidatus Dormibacteraeota bacterium]
MSDLVAELRAICGDAFVVVGEALEDYTHDATFLESPPLCAVRPADTDQVAATVAACARSRTPVVARGAGTSLVGGPVPLAGGVVLSLDRLDSIEIDAGNTVAVAGAGAITAQIDAAAGEHGLMYPPDPASYEMSSIGGNVACNSGGMRCVKYGVTADYVIGLTAVLADGRILKLGGRLRKRSSGYRLLQLFVGSEGTLGIVTEVVLKLVPQPRYRSTAMVGFRRLEEAGEAVARALAAGHFPAAIEIMDRGSIELVGDRLPPGFATGLEAVLIVEQDGSDEEFVQLDLLKMVELLGGADNRVAQSSLERERLWEARRSFGKVLMAMPKNFFAEDVAVPISAIPEMIRRVQALAQRTGLRIVTVGHAGDGNLHPTFLFADEKRHLVSGAAATIFRDAIELGGSISAEHGLGALKRDYAEVEHGALAMATMRSLKRLFDPDGILNPHKVFPEQPAGDEFLNQMPGWMPDPSRPKRRAELGL